jgi:adsorption protein B
VPLAGGQRGLIVTREYFPRRAISAIRQRTRWVTGIALQCWERSGWKGSAWSRYWFWRDRKGLLTNPLSFFTNLLFAAGLVDWFASAAAHRQWLFAIDNPTVVYLCWLTMILQCVRLAIRMLCVARVYGWLFAAGVPLRCFHGNFLNCCASFGAVWIYMRARRARQPLAWLKTEHAYPSREALLLQKRELADVLVGHGYISENELLEIQNRIPENADLAEHLIAAGALSDEDLLSALSLQSGVPLVQVDHRKIKPRVTRSLPAHLEQRFGVVPFGVDSGRLLVATQRVPAPEALNEIKSYTRLLIEPQLVTKENYQQLRKVMYS